jgi:tripartite-type tricarboxylate transporter receptor subunit TctC
MRSKKYKGTFIAVAFGCILLIALASPLWSQQAYPTKPVNVLIGYGAGGVVVI